MHRLLIPIVFSLNFVFCHSFGALTIKGPFSQKVCCTEIVCFTDMEVISDNPQDSIWVWLVNTDGIPVNYSATWNGSFQQWNLCWQTKDSDGKLEPYTFDICATNKKDTVCKTYRIQVDPLPKSCRTYTYLGNDSFLFQLTDTSRYARGDSTIRFCEWTVPYPSGNKYYDCSIKFKNSGLKYILVQSRLNATYFGCDITELDTVDLQKLAIKAGPSQLYYQITQEHGRLYVQSPVQVAEEIMLYQLDGKIVKSFHLSSVGVGSISVEDLSSGVYILVSSQTIFVRKIIIQH